MNWRSIKLSTIVLALAGLGYVPYYAYQNMLERKKVETAEQSYAVDPLVPGVSVVTTAKDFLGQIEFVDKTRVSRIGLGVMIITLDEYKKVPETLQGVKVDDNDFPLVAEFNVSGYDYSGAIVALYRAADGKVFDDGKNFGNNSKQRFVAQMTLRHDAKVRVVYLDRKEEVFTVEQWQEIFTGGELEPEPQPAADAKGKSGVKGVVYAVKTTGAPTPLPDLPVFIFKGSQTPIERVAPTDGRLAAAGQTAKDGTFQLALPPGEYTLTIQVDGKLRGNALDQARWPTFQVKDDLWTNYEVRVLDRR